MSFYRSPSSKQAYNWREREAEAKRKATEEQTKKGMQMTTQNFPSLGGVVNTKEVAIGTQYSKLAKDWAIDTEVLRKKESDAKFREAIDRREVRFRRQESRGPQERYDYDYEYTEDVASGPIYRSTVMSDELGWTQISRKTKKIEREMTIDELDERAMEDDEQDNSGYEHNAHMFDSNRHDHDRV
jgi:hypothetical protein